MDEIIPNLYLSSLSPASNISALLAANITLVLTIASTDLPLSVRQSYLSADITQHQIPALDEPSFDLLCTFNETCDLIKNNLAESKGVLVHSGMGVSRSATVVVAYIMKVRMLGTFEAVDFVKKKHGAAQPNRGFVNQLMVWEECECDIFEDMDGHRRAKRVYLEWKEVPCKGKEKGKQKQVARGVAA